MPERVESYTAGDARLKMRDILSAVERGERVMITRYDTPTAVVVSPAEAGEVVAEYGQERESGDYLVWGDDPEYPAAHRVEYAARTGGKVRRRRVIVVEDWTEVSETEA
jgi:prevent-host-death family protein